MRAAHGCRQRTGASYQSAGLTPIPRARPVVNNTPERREDVSGEFPIQCTWIGGNFSTSPHMAQSRQQKTCHDPTLDSKTTSCISVVYLFICFDIPKRHKQVVHRKTDEFHPPSLSGWHKCRQDSRSDSPYNHKMINSPLIEQRSDMVQDRGREMGRGSGGSFTSVRKGQGSTMSGIRICPGSMQQVGKDTVR